MFRATIVLSLAALLCAAFGCGPAELRAGEGAGGEVEEPFASAAIAVPGRVEAEAYRGGGEGVGYHDTTAGNTGGAYRTDDVDIQATSDAGGGHAVGWIAQGEWLAYVIEIPRSGSYVLTARVASGISGTKALHLEVDGYPMPAVRFDDAAGWQRFRDLPLGARHFGANVHMVKVHADTGGFNLNYLELREQDGCTETTCAAQGARCGSVADGCGGTLACGGCPEGQTCKAGACAAAGGVAGMSIDGNHLLKDGQPFYPRGFNMIGLLTPDGCPTPPGPGVAARKAFGQAALTAARTAWAANTLRFQVSQRGLDSQDPIFGQAYVDRVRAGVALARSLGFVVIVSMQDQFYSCGSAHPLPSQATLRAWSTLVPLLRNDPYVMFELFNEPVSQLSAADWAQWTNGGTSPVDNQGLPAVGHQQLVRHVRALGATNVLIADGANRAGKLQGLPLLADTLPRPQIMYAVHPYYFHIANNSSLAQDTANWDTRFGYLAPRAAIIATEWNAQNNACNAGAAARIPDLFAYLEGHDIGLLGHAFDVAGTLVKDLTAFAPTTMAGYGCDVKGADAGELLQAHFKQLAARAPVPPPPPPTPTPTPSSLNVYFGNLHSHTIYSDGAGTPAEHFKLAKATGFDFYMISDHALAKYAGYTAANYADTKAAAAAATDAAFVALAGFEFSENSDPAGTGHLNAVNTDATLDASAAGVNLPSFYDWMAAAAQSRAVVACFNHPAPTGYNGYAYLTAARREVVALHETVHAGGSHYPALIAALDKGWRVSPVGALDNHGLGRITSHDLRTAVLAPSRTREALLSALRQRRSYGTWDRNLRLSYTVNGQIMGSVLKAPSSLAFAIEVDDPDASVSGDAITRIEIVSEGGAVVAAKSFDAHSVSWAPTLAPAKKYYLLLVYARDLAAPTAYSAPIWIE